MAIKGVIFDLDGVIVSTDSLHYLGWKKISDEENIYFDKEINNRLRGVSRMESLDIILEKSNKPYSNEEKIALASKKNSYYVEYLSGLSEKDILPGVLETLNLLKERGVKIAIGSSSKNAGMILSQAGLSNYFDAVADGNDIKNSKPHPEVFLLAAERLNLSADECAVVEDAFSGIDAANTAGMTSVAVSDACEYDKADFRLSNIKELLNVIDSI